MVDVQTCLSPSITSLSMYTAAPNRRFATWLFSHMRICDSLRETFSGSKKASRILATHGSASVAVVHSCLQAISTCSVYGPLSKARYLTSSEAWDRS